MTSFPRRTRPWVLIAAVLLGVVPRLIPTASAAEGGLVLRTLSNRADLVSGGDVLVEVVLPRGGSAKGLQASLGGHDVSAALALRPNGRVEGLLTGLPAGGRDLVVRLADGRGARLRITNHPSGGPVFAGPQVRPWSCTTVANGLGPARDRQCDAPTRISYVYKSTDPTRSGFQPYDVSKPATDVAVTTTDQGVRTPYIVRVETGTLDRGVYQTAVLADPRKPWAPWASQRTWNHKLMVPFGGSCAAKYAQTAPAGTSASDGVLVGGVLDDAALSRGFAVTSSGLNTLGNNCNEVVSAEALMMQKEHIAETLGPIRYTIGEGASGGSIQQQNIAATYPGLLDGITPSASFADVWTTANEVFECGLLDHYFTSTSPHLWAVAPQRAAVEGHANVGSSCLAWTALFLPALDPTGNGPLGTGTTVTDNGCGTPADQRYSAARRTGVRCDIADYDKAILGTRRPDGFARRPLDNVGVQYGLNALNSGEITPDQFVDLNAKVGGYDIDLNPQAQRTQADPGVIAAAYASGRISDGHLLATVPMIDLRGQDNEEIHQSFYSYAMRARLDQANGAHANQVIWTGAVPLLGDSGFTTRAFLAMDRWLARIEADRSQLPLAAKVIRDRPADTVDSCWVQGHQITDTNLCRAALPYYSNPRMVAGGPWANNVLQCALRPMNRVDYAVAFSDAQWAALRAAFPHGVCDWSRPGPAQRRVIAWASYAAGRGARALGPVPRSRSL